MSPVFLMASLWMSFSNPPQDSKPWTYWLWKNTHVDRATIEADLSDISNLGFGGVLFSDSRGYWEDDDHVRIPKAEVRWGSDVWLDLVADSIRVAATNGIKFAMNIAASGGHLRGECDVGEDAPKFLKCRVYLPGDKWEDPEIPHYRDVAAFAVRVATPERTGWQNAGDGFLSMERNFGERKDGQEELKQRRALEVRELASPEDRHGLSDEWVVVRFGFGTLNGQENDVDVLDGAAVRRHLDRSVGRLISRVTELCGTNRTFTSLYNVSWEGAMPTWSVTFEGDFRRIEGYDIRPVLPALAGFLLEGRDSNLVMRAFRHARGVMMREHLYETVRSWAHEHALMAFSESGGPWGFGKRNPKTFGECDQLAFLAANDYPQGEFWPLAERGDSVEADHANGNGRFFTRGVVSAAHAYGMRICSAEAFTHMLRHWSVDPAFLKPIGDQAFADGINRFVWHTYTASPDSFGVPGLEYFAGSHINRRVTWHADAFAFVRYLSRCQAVLQQGEPVVDVAILCGNRPYVGEGIRENGRLRNSAAWGLDVVVPEGYASDVLNDDVLARRPGILKNYRIVYDARLPGKRGHRVPTKGLLPDVETDSGYTWCHRKACEADVYFMAGEGPATVVFRASSAHPELWDAVTGRRVGLDCARMADGRTRVELNLPRGGSCFVVFGQDSAAKSSSRKFVSRLPLRMETPWRVAFSYPVGIGARPPAPLETDRLFELTTRDETRHFSGMVFYCADFQARGTESYLSLGDVPSGLAHVWVNGLDCGTAWCSPWEVDVSSAVRQGRNRIEIRYTNNWANRLIGDCALPERDRVTRSAIRYWSVPRTQSEPGKPWTIKPTVYSGYSAFDPLQKSGILGPIEIVEVREEVNGSDLQTETERSW